VGELVAFVHDDLKEIKEIIHSECGEVNCCELVKYIQGLLPSKRMKEILAHTESCPICWWNTPYYRRAPKLSASIIELVG
jgi:hypothetical protein